MTGDTTAVIVALPPAVDPIRLVGDEEKHASLLFFGETASLPEEAKTAILETLGTASTMFRPFSEEIIDISRLGSDAPPALVAKLSDRCLTQIREALQINPAIVTYMRNVAQHPSYIPHVTLGYPDWTGEEQLRELCKTLYSVNFDRIALWWNDERFEFKLGKEEGGQLKMKAPLDDFLAHAAVDYALEHATKKATVGDVYDSLSEEQKDLAAVVIGADLEGVDVPGDIDLQAIYDSYSPDQKLVLDFIAGGIDQALEHEDLSTEFLAHSGVKGMKWGIRKSERGTSTRLSKNVTTNQRLQARDKIKAGTGTLKDAHVASIKSTGHRAINAFLGDKTYWKRTAIIAGVAASVAAAAVVAPSLMSVGTLAAVGKASYDFTGLGPIHLPASVYASLGKNFIQSTGVNAALAGAAVAKTVNSVDNLVRAVRGNKRIDKSYEKLGREVTKRQRTGNKKVQGVLKRNGSLRGKKLEDHGNTEDRDPAVAAAVERAFAKSDAAQHDGMNLVDSFLAHHGIKGMKWGIRRDRSSSDGGGKAKQKFEGDKAVVKAADRARPGTVAIKKDADGKIIGTMVKAHDGTWKDTELSADAEKFVKARMKPTHEMSDAEIREAMQRANLVRQYNDFFSEKPSSELQAKVAHLELEKRYRELSRQLTPAPQPGPVRKLISGAGSAYTAYSKLDKATGGAVATQLGKKLTGVLDPATAAAASRKALLENQRFEANVAKAVTEAALAEKKLKKP